MIGPQQDPYQKAAYLYLDGDVEGAWSAVEDVVKEKAAEDYAPDHDADEDGEWVDYDRPARGAISHEITIAAEHISDAIWEILTNEQGVEDEAAQTRAAEVTNELDALWQKHTDDLASDLVDNFKDGAAYSRDPHAYYGVSRKDFF
jgi:hypothetical protein